MNGQARRWDLEKITSATLIVVGIGMIIYHLAYTQILIQSPVGHRITHLGVALVIVCMSLMQRKKKGKALCLSLGACSIIVTLYFMIYLNQLLEYRSTMPLTIDLVMGVGIMIICFVANYAAFGKTFTIISGLAVVYLVFGRYVPQPFTVPAVSMKRIIMWLGASVGTEEGIYGDMLSISANQLFLFIVFGSLLHALGGTRFVIGFGRWIGSKLQSGPAMTALCGSSLLGMITGSTVANIMIMGSFTIPMMKKAGYKPEQAAAIETVCSNSGQLIPPVMGATAFVMAGFADIPYVKIMIAAIGPSIVLVGCIFFYIILTSRKMRISAPSEPVKARAMLFDSPIFFIPLGMLAWLLVKGYSLPFVVFWGTCSVLLLGLLSSALRKDARLDFREVLRIVMSGVVSGCEFALITALLGILVSSVVTSGLAIKLPLAISDMSQGVLLIALFITGMTSLILGIGVPTPAAYMLVAIGAVPTLLRMGVPVLEAHLFCFYYAMCSHITPPVAVGALAASQLAGSDYWKTCWEALKAAFPKLLLPFFWVYAPVILLRPNVGFWDSAIQVAAVLMVIASLQMGVSQFCFTTLRLNETILFIVASILSFGALVTNSSFLLLVGFVLLAGSLVRQFLRNHSEPWGRILQTTES